MQKAILILFTFLMIGCMSLKKDLERSFSSKDGFVDVRIDSLEMSLRKLEIDTFLIVKVYGAENKFQFIHLKKSGDFYQRFLVGEPTYRYTSIVKKQDSVLDTLLKNPTFLLNELKTPIDRTRVKTINGKIYEYQIPTGPYGVDITLSIGSNKGYKEYNGITLNELESISPCAFYITKSCILEGIQFW